MQNPVEHDAKTNTTVSRSSFPNGWFEKEFFEVILSIISNHPNGFIDEPVSVFS